MFFIVYTIAQDTIACTFNSHLFGEALTYTLGLRDRNPEIPAWIVQMEPDCPFGGRTVWASDPQTLALMQRAEPLPLA